MSERVRETIIKESDFAKVLSARLREYLRFLNLLRTRDTGDWVKRHYSELAERSDDAETLLDDYEARNNKSFGITTEFVAALKGFGKVAAALKHLMSRFPRYNVSVDAGLAGEFFAETEHTMRFLDQSILEVVKALFRELGERGVEIPTDATEDSAVADAEMRYVLPHNIDEEDVLDEEQEIAEFASKFVSVSDLLVNAVQLSSTTGPGEFVLKHFDEEHARDIESRVHSLQSKYDTYIKSTALESRTPALSRLRGHVSIALHLLEMGTEFVHFYVRHENDIRYESAKQKIAELVDKSLVLDRAVNYSLRFASRIISAARVHADEVIGTFVKLQEIEVAIPAEATLHARPISLIVKIVNHYGTLVDVDIDGTTCNGSSIMEMIMAAGNNPSVRTLRFQGDSRPLQDIRLLFEHGMGENGLKELPAELEYLT